MAGAFIPRPAQQAILAYDEGYMGVSAVPGSGKTFTLSLLAAQLVERLALAGSGRDREVLVVTFTNSAVANFRARIGAILREEKGLLPGVGYRVRTLHGLAHDIVRERPGLVGLSEEFAIIDDRTTNEIKRDAVRAFLRAQPDAFGAYVAPEFVAQLGTPYLQNRVEEYAIELAQIGIRFIKELRWDPADVRQELNRARGRWPLLNFAVQVYGDYQRSLAIRGGVDFDDLIMLALRALQSDDSYLLRLQERWPFVLEDEAQDSSLVQERMLRLLTARAENWVRVGDPNQAINTTFTSANTRYLREFLARYPAGRRDLPNSGRCAEPIIGLANQLIEWSQAQEILGVHALTPPLIQPTPPGDPQPNPEPGPRPIVLHQAPFTSDEEMETVVKSLRKWLMENPERTAAVLIVENERGKNMADLLKAANVPYDDSLLKADTATREAVAALAALVHFIANPHKTPSGLNDLWLTVWLRRRALPWLQTQEIVGEFPRKSEDLPQPLRSFADELRRLAHTELLLFPETEDWLDSARSVQEQPWLGDLARFFRVDLQRWSRAALLPIDELLLTVGNDLFADPLDLAITHRLAVLLAKLQKENPHWRLPELAGALDEFANNRRRLTGMADDAAGFEPKPGFVTISTMHSAKGLEWDRVHLLGVNSYSFPDGSERCTYMAEKYWVRERLNLGAELERQIKQLQQGPASLDDYQEGAATAATRVALAGERLRLLYVGITRARRELIITWNTGRGKEPARPALAFAALAGK